MLESFETKSIDTDDGVRIHARIAGEGPPLLMLHGFPQTHACWHRIAGELANYFTVVLTDLRGYGASGKPEGGINHVNYSKRVMARDQVSVMSGPWVQTFLCCGT
jgi:haloacetate dehalogenase